MGNVTTGDIKNTMQEGTTRIEQIKNKLDRAQQNLLNEMVAKGYLSNARLDLSDPVLRSLCENLIYTRVSDFIALLSPTEYMGAKYILGLRVDDKKGYPVTSHLPNKKSVCEQLTRFITEKITLMATINGMLKQCDLYIDYINNLKISENNKNLKRIHKTYETFIGNYENLTQRTENLMIRVKNAVTEAELLRYSNLVDVLFTDFTNVCYQASINIYKLSSI